MANNVITRETWEQAKDDTTRLNILFDLMFAANQRLEALEKRKIVDTVGSCCGGVVGGVLTVLGKMAIWKT